LQVIVDGKEQIAFVHVIAFAYFQHLDAPLLVGRHEDQFGFDPALQDPVVAIVAAAEHQRGQHRYTQAIELHFHALLGAKSSST
jgi:hypothetical protein